MDSLKRFICLEFHFDTISQNVYLMMRPSPTCMGSAGLYCGNVVLQLADVAGARRKSERKVKISTDCVKMNYSTARRTHQFRSIHFISGI